MKRHAPAASGRRRKSCRSCGAQRRRVMTCVMDELDVQRTASGTIVEMSKEWSANAQH
jgi:hypothetical protein